MIRKLLIDKTQAAHMQFLRYFFVGGTAAVVDLFLYTLLLTYVGFHYAAAAFFAYMAGLAWNHFLCVIWVFQSKHSRAKEVLMVFLIAVGGLLWTWLILYVMITLLTVDPILSKIVSQVLVLVWNFTMRKFYVFH